MTTLYSDLALVYEAMYYTFIDYHEEYKYYAKILNQYHKKQVVEIGSGTGNLAGYFQQVGFDYTGLDFSPEMIQIAAEKHPTARFVQGDMRDFTLATPVESMLITARSISYITDNVAVQNTFQSIAKNLQTGGVLCFDIIDANRFIPAMMENGNISHYADYQGVEYRRDSLWSPTLKQGMDMIWTADYFKKEKGEWLKLGSDRADVRSFTVDEMRIFLELNGFDVLAVEDRETYFFPTYVITAKRK